MAFATAQTTAAQRDLLRIADLDTDTLTGLLDLAEDMKGNPAGWLDAHPGELLACYFAKPSTRTRVSFEGAAYRLGMLPVMLRPDELQLGRGEPISDTARVLSGYASAIVIRTFAQSDVAEMADAANVPVINALTDDHHPCQALADLLTLREHFGELKGLRVTYVGDSNNVACSLMEAGALAGMHITVASPGGYGPATGICAEMHAVARSNGGSVQTTYEVEKAVSGAQAIYTDVWVSMGQEEQGAQKLIDLAGFQVNERLMAMAAPDAVFMHCLPAHRGEEVTAGVIDGPQSIVFAQADNRLPTAQAVIETLIQASRAAGEA